MGGLAALKGLDGHISIPVRLAEAFFWSQCTLPISALNVDVNMHTRSYAPGRESLSFVPSQAKTAYKSRKCSISHIVAVIRIVPNYVYKEISSWPFYTRGPGPS